MPLRRVAASTSRSSRVADANATQVRAGLLYHTETCSGGSLLRHVRLQTTLAHYGPFHPSLADGNWSLMHILATHSACRPLNAATHQLLLVARPAAPRTVISLALASLPRRLVHRCRTRLPSSESLCCIPAAPGPERSDLSASSPPITG
jgi:hypothetical protein